jgi:hypothetical protein
MATTISYFATTRLIKRMYFETSQPAKIRPPGLSVVFRSYFGAIPITPDATAKRVETQTYFKNEFISYIN